MVELYFSFEFPSSAFLSPQGLRKLASYEVAGKSSANASRPKRTPELSGIFHRRFATCRFSNILRQNRFQLRDGFLRPVFPVGHDGVLQRGMTRPVRFSRN